MIEVFLGILLALGGALILALRSLGKVKEKNEQMRKDAATKRRYEDAVEKSNAGGGDWNDRLRGDNNRRGL